MFRQELRGGSRVDVCNEQAFLSGCANSGSRVHDLAVLAVLACSAVIFGGSSGRAKRALSIERVTERGESKQME